MSLRKINKKMKEMENPALYEIRKKERNFLVKRFLTKLFWSVLFMIALPRQCMVVTVFQPIVIIFTYIGFIGYLLREFLFMLNELEH